MLLTEQEVDALRKSLPAVCKHQDVIRAAESAVLEKLKAQEPVAFKQFLSDVHTAAGLLRHGKKDQWLADRISRGAMDYLANPLPPDDVLQKTAESPIYTNAAMKGGAA